MGKLIIFTLPEDMTVTVNGSPYSGEDIAENTSVTIAASGVNADLFSGWYLDGQKLDSLTSRTFTMPNKDVRLYAWVNRTMVTSGSLEDALNSVIDIANDMIYDRVIINETMFGNIYNRRLASGYDKVEETFKSDEYKMYTKGYTGEAYIDLRDYGFSVVSKYSNTQQSSLYVFDDGVSIHGYKTSIKSFRTSVDIGRYSSSNNNLLLNGFTMNDTSIACTITGDMTITNSSGGYSDVTSIERNSYTRTISGTSGHSRVNHLETAIDLEGGSVGLYSVGTNDFNHISSVVVSGNGVVITPGYMTRLMNRTHINDFNSGKVNVEPTAINMPSRLVRSIYLGLPDSYWEEQGTVTPNTYTRTGIDTFYGLLFVDDESLDKFNFIKNNTIKLEKDGVVLFLEPGRNYIQNVEDGTYDTELQYYNEGGHRYIYLQLDDSDPVSATFTWSVLKDYSKNDMIIGYTEQGINDLTYNEITWEPGDDEPQYGWDLFGPTDRADVESAVPEFNEMYVAIEFKVASGHSLEFGLGDNGAVLDHYSSGSVHSVTFKLGEKTVPTADSNGSCRFQLGSQIITGMYWPRLDDVGGWQSGDGVIMYSFGVDMSTSPYVDYFDRLTIKVYNKKLREDI